MKITEAIQNTEFVYLVHTIDYTTSKDYVTEAFREHEAALESINNRIIRDMGYGPGSINGYYIQAVRLN